MSEVLRSTTFQINFNGESGNQGIRTFTKAVTDADKTVEELNRRLGENATVTYSAVRSKKELTAEAIAAVREIERTAKTVAALTRNYEHQISLVGKTAQQQAALNAAYALGANATDEQKNKVMELATALQRIQEEESEIARASAERIANDAKIDKQMQQAAQRYQELSGELQRYISLIDKSADEQEIANTVAKLGANATEEQKNKVAQLTANLVSLRNAQKAKSDAERISNAEAEKTKVNLARITQQYQFLSSTVGKTADEIEQLNAANALGANASEAQRQQVIQQVQQYQQLRGSVEGAQGSMRNFRGVMQNVGWQAQDTAVQLQMGTSAFVVFSQQGSQIASAFGPTGALIGALIAVGGVVGGTLYKSLNSATGAMERLDKINKELANYLTVTASGVTELSSKLEELAIYSKRAADEQLRLSRADAIKAQSESVLAIINALNNAKPFGGTMRQSLGLTVDSVVELSGSVSALQKEVNKDNLERYLNALSEINPQAKGASKGAAEVKQALLDQYYQMSKGIKILDDTADGWQKLSDKTTDSIDEVAKAFNSEYMSLVKQTETTQEEYDRRKKIIDDYAASEKANQEKVKESYDNLNKWKKQEDEKAGKERVRLAKAASNKIITAFNTEYLALTKQTESVNQEYERRKVIIDNYVTEVGRQDEKSKAAYEALDQWKAQQLDKEFGTLVKSLVKRTNTVQEEYDRQKQIINYHVARVGSVDSDAAEAYAALEKWKTDKLRAEYDSRESIRRRIENAQIRSRRGEDPVGAENDLFATNMKTLNDQKAQLGKEQLEEQTRINALIEGEQLRHNRAMDAAQLQSYQNVVAVASIAAQQLSSIVDLMTSGVQDVQSKTKEMNGVQKTMFLTMQTISAAMALVNGISMGSTLAASAALYDWTGVTSASWLAFGTAVGAANAGAIMGVTLAGAFDKGGNIPAGQAGIVSEYGDELVNGVLVKGPARVTSREETARMMNQGSNVSLKISIENQIPGAVYEQQQLSADEVRIIARQEFNKNIDEGVSNVLASGNSKSSKSLRRNYKTQRNL